MPQREKQWQKESSAAASEELLNINVPTAVFPTSGQKNHHRSSLKKKN